MMSNGRCRNVGDAAVWTMPPYGRCRRGARSHISWRCTLRKQFILLYYLRMAETFMQLSVQCFPLIRFAPLVVLILYLTSPSHSEHGYACLELQGVGLSCDATMWTAAITCCPVNANFNGKVFLRLENKARRRADSRECLEVFNPAINVRIHHQHVMVATS